MSDLPLPPLPDELLKLWHQPTGRTPRSPMLLAQLVQAYAREAVSAAVERERNRVPLVARNCEQDGCCYDELMEQLQAKAEKGLEPVALVRAARAILAKACAVESLADEITALETALDAHPPTQVEPVAERVLMQRRLQSATDLCENEWYPWEEVFGPHMTKRQTDIFEYAWFESAHLPVQPTEPDHFAWWAKDNIPKGTDVAVVMLCRRAWRAASAPVQPMEPYQAKADADRLKDAERYRWLRRSIQPNGLDRWVIDLPDPGIEVSTDKVFDAAIDAAMTKELDAYMDGCNPVTGWANND